MSPRDYSSPVREESKRQTRETILEALVRVIVDQGVHAFTVGNVAKRAGVSSRTVYRHFATREELLDSLTDSIDSTPVGSTPMGSSETPILSDFARVQQLFSMLDQRRELAIAETVAAAALGHLPRAKRIRWAFLRAEVQRMFPNLDPDEQLAGAAVIRALASTNSWFHLCVQLGLPSGPVASGVARTLHLVIEDMKQRNEQRSNTHG